MALFTFSTNGFVLSGKWHGLWQHLNFISYNVEEILGETEKEDGSGGRKQTDSFPKCEIKAF